MGTDSDDERAEVAKEDPMIGVAMDALKTMSANPEARRAVITREEALMLYRMEINVANEEGIATGKREGREEGIEEGVKKGVANSVLSVLAFKGVDVTQQVRDAIEGCNDAGLLQRWLMRALSMQAGDAFLAD